MGEGDSENLRGEAHGREELTNAATSPTLWGLTGCVYLRLLPTSGA